MSQMDHRDRIPEDMLINIADQLGSLIGGLCDDPITDESPIELGESFGVWMLGMDSIEDDLDIERTASFIDRWHHQIRFADIAKAFGRSTRRSGAWSLVEFSVSPLADQIDDAIKWIDNHIPDPQIVRLLVVPNLLLHALWLPYSDDVLVVDSPFCSLPFGEMLSPREFIRRSRGDHVVRKGMMPLAHRDG